jgi:thioester reductase-like protein
VTVYRPTRISADSRTGICQEQDFFWLLLKSCIAAGIAPTGADMAFDLVPVDYVGAAVAGLSGQAAAANRTFHIASEHRVRLRTAIEWLRRHGYRIRDGSLADWTRRIEATRQPTGLALLSTLRTGADQEGGVIYDAAATRSLLPDLSVPPLDTALFAACVEHFVTTGFFPPALRAYGR